MAKAHPTSRIIEYDKTAVRGRVPYASRMLTYATKGGPPFGHWIREYGPEGSGKSLSNLGLIYVAQNLPAFVTESYELRIKHFERTRNKLAALKMKREMKQLLVRFPNGLETLFYDTEGRHDESFAERLGIDNKRVELSDENVIENIADQIAQGVDTFHLIIIDSVSNAQSVITANTEPGDPDQPGADARAWKRFRQVRQRFDRHENLLVFVDQVRSNLGTGGRGGKIGSQAKPVPSNIRFLKHNISLDIEFEQGGKLYLDDNGVITDDYDKASNLYKALGVPSKEVAGLDIRCRVQKNSTGTPFRPARMRFCFDVADYRTGELVQEVRFDEEFELLEVGIDFGIIEKLGGGNHVVLDDKFRPTKKKARSGAKMRAMIADDDELRERIITRLLLAT